MTRAVSDAGCRRRRYFASSQYPTRPAAVRRRRRRGCQAAALRPFPDADQSPTPCGIGLLRLQTPGRRLRSERDDVAHGQRQRHEGLTVLPGLNAHRVAAFRRIFWALRLLAFARKTSTMGVDANPANRRKPREARSLKRTEGVIMDQSTKTHRRRPRPPRGRRAKARRASRGRSPSSHRAATRRE